MRALPITLSTLLASIAALVAFELAEPSKIVDLEVTSVQVEVGLLREAVLQYKSVSGALPANLDQLVASEFINRLPKDRWGNRYIYRQTESQEGFAVYSPGIDAIDQNGGGDDVVTSEKEYACATYGANCPLSLPSWGKLISASTLALSIAGLIVLGGLRAYRSHSARSRRKDKVS